MAQTIKVATIVVSYNPYKSGFFPHCLEYIKKVTLSNHQYQIDQKVIIVDSHSGDNTPELVREQYPEFDLIASQTNLGYAGGNNAGFKKALEWGAEYIAVVTQDVYVKEDWLFRAIEVAQKDKTIGIVQPLLLLYPQRDLINSTGNATHFLGYGYARDYQKPLSTYAETEPQEVPYASGAALVLNAKALRDVGFFDDEMWMYNEDQDLGWRMWLKGYKNVMAPFCRGYHQYEFSRSISKLYYMDRNRLLVILQNYRLATIILVLPALVLNEIAGFFLAWRGGWLKEKLSVWKYFLKPSSWKILLEKRRIRQSGRTTSDKEIIKRFTGAIHFQDVMNPVVKYIANPILSLYFVLLRLIIWW